jgi:UDP-N-acetylmuramoyl-tripeptide--D-alanyl-D-alanine ligase
MEIYLKDIKERFPEFEIRNYDEEVFFTAFSHDSRTIRNGEIFIPIVGERFDGHDFIVQALSDGASMAICEAKKSLLVKDAIKPVILVDSIQEGLQKLMSLYISRIDAPVVGITGSVGKTTTRKILSTILSSNGSVLSAEGSNINTVWGNAVLFSRYTDEKYIVLECGMDHPGEIAWHMNSEDPDLGILLNVGCVHAEAFGSIEGVYEEKKNMVDYLDKMGRPLILNIDDERLQRIVPLYKSKLVTYGYSSDADFRIESSVLNQDGIDFKFVHKGDSYSGHLKAYGEKLVYNVIAAIATAAELGMSIEDALNALDDFEPESGRFEIITLRNGDVIINDAYNANPISMKMSLQTFDKLYPKEAFHRIVVLGDMKELGEISPEKHNELGKLVESMRFEEIYYIGEYFKDFDVGEELQTITEAAGMIKEVIDHNRDKKIAILCKGSHSTGIYEIPNLVRNL